MQPHTNHTLHQSAAPPSLPPSPYPSACLSSHRIGYCLYRQCWRWRCCWTLRNAGIPREPELLNTLWRQTPPSWVFEPSQRSAETRCLLSLTLSINFTGNGTTLYTFVWIKESLQLQYFSPNYYIWKSVSCRRTALQPLSVAARDCWLRQDSGDYWYLLIFLIESLRMYIRISHPLSKNVY